MKFKGIPRQIRERVRCPVVAARSAFGVSPSVGVGESLSVPGSALGLVERSTWDLNLRLQIFVNHKYLYC